MPASDHKRRLTAFVVAMALLIATPLAVVATDAFTDVSESGVHHDNITWLKDAGVTSGCNPPDNDEYCPTDNVTRAQMATFMRNLATNQVVDAATAIDSEQLGGKDGVSYETIVAAAACTVNSSGTSTNCGPNSDGSVPDQTTIELVHVDISAPAAGILTIHGHGVLNTVTWLALNETCTTFETAAIVAQSVNSTLFGGSTSATGAASTATSVPAGDHTVRLCTAYAGTNGEGSVSIANLVAQWNAGGTVDVQSVAPGDGEPLDLGLGD